MFVNQFHGFKPRGKEEANIHSAERLFVEWV